MSSPPPEFCQSPKDGALSSISEKQRRYRARRRAGFAVARIEIDRFKMIDALVMAGILAEPDVDDPAKVSQAIARVLADWQREIFRYR